MAPAQAVIFDLYETLVTEYDPDWRLPPSPAKRLGISDAAFAAAWDLTRNARLLGQIPDHASVLRSICERAGVEPDERAIADLVALRRAAKAKPFAEVDQSVAGMLRRLRDRGLKLAVLTNATRDETHAWAGCAVAHLFDHIVVSAEVGLLKPDARIYGLACERLGVAPEVAAFVGDGGSGELQGAAGVGLAAYWATWFIDRWPWDRPEAASDAAAAKAPRLRRPGQLVDALAGR